MEYEIIGGSFPIVECTLKAGEAMITQSGSMAWMETSTNGGIGKVVGRLFTKEALFQNIYTSEKDGSKIAFGTAVPGSIRAIKIEAGKTVICQKSSFLASYGNVEVSTFFNKKIGVGIFGGEGFIMQKFSGEGIVFVEIDDTCQIDVQTIKGMKNIFLGGEGIFNTVITGPGKVVVQTMPLAKLSNSIAAYLPLNNSSSGSGNDAIDAGVSIFKMFNK